MSSIQIRNTTKQFGALTAVDNLNLEIENGEFVALLGPSGCGKTTTMNMIAGMEHPTSGQILFDGEDLSDTRIQDRGVGFVFQNYAIFTHLSVHKNLSYALEVTRVPPSEIETRVNAMARRMNIEHRLQQKASTLSVNEMQKLAIGRSAIAEPRIFLLDEPLSNLDSVFRAYMRSELKVLQHEFKQTMVYVTHDQIEAMSLADRIAVIDKGVLQQFGDPLEVYNDPSNVFVANFIGSPSMNLIEGTLAVSEGKPELALGPLTTIGLDDMRFATLVERSAGNRLVLGVRPEFIYTGAKRTAGDIALTGVIDVIERIGPKKIAHVQMGGFEIRINSDDPDLRPGQQVEFCLPASKCLLFDADTGNRIRI
ncbi:ABC transporter ATP-binding protein [Hoeflea sp. TYP-13]|uniref:ABC transporter ATP-binding protein n=1 Tax=Hoeflea sp. TYP-13 TaxID=3230023 RepID=UPI0034C640B9